MRQLNYLPGQKFLYKLKLLSEFFITPIKKSKKKSIFYYIKKIL